MASIGGMILELRESDRGVTMVAKEFVLNLSSKARALVEKPASSSMTWGMDNLYQKECASTSLPRENARKEMIVATNILLKTTGLQMSPYLQALALTSSGRDSVKGELIAGNNIASDASVDCRTLDSCRMVTLLLFLLCADLVIAWMIQGLLAQLQTRAGFVFLRRTSTHIW